MPPDGDNNQGPLLLVGPFPPPDNPAWATQVGGMLRALWSNTDSDGTPLSSDRRQRIEDILFRESNIAPEEFLTLQETVGGEFGWQAPDDAAADFQSELSNGLVDALTGALSGRARNIVNNITETRRATGEQEAVTTVTATGEQVTTTGLRETEFVELPTPEEFLDNFQVGLATWADNMLQSGQIDVGTRDFVLSNPRQFYDSYLAEQGRLAEAGEDPFRVVGLEGAAERLGERFGGLTRAETTRVSTEERISDTELNELINTTIERLTGSISDGAPQDISENIRTTVENVFRERQETTTREQFQSISTTLSVEEIFGRPQLAQVAALAPLDFLRGQFTPISVKNLAAGPGQISPVEARRAAVPSAPRRLGG